MIITAEDFKGIKGKASLDLSRINVLTGSNSGGKSTWIQLILLIKQSLENNSLSTPVKVNSPYVKLGNINKIINNSTPKNKHFSFGVKLGFPELNPRIKRDILLIENAREKLKLGKTLNANTGVQLSFQWKIGQNSKGAPEIIEHQIYLTNESNLGATKFINLLTLTKQRGRKCKIASEAIGNVYPDLLPEDCESTTSAEINFSGLHPSWAFSSDESYHDIGPLIRNLQLTLDRKFKLISYIGPLREEPKEFYFQEDDGNLKIGNKGENATYILASEAKEKIKCPLFPEYSDEFFVPEKELKFEEAVNYWLCNIFDLAKSIKSERTKANNRIHALKVTSKAGHTVPITNVGFGVSQIFPVIVEGLRSKSGTLIILEQPEIHLHPKVQSLLLDFVVATAKKRGLKFLIETHSDHLINRLRRRIAEDKTSKLVNDISLSFTFDDGDCSKTEKLDLSDLGMLNHWPKGFFDQYDDDTRAIVRAQAQKRKIKKERENES